MCFGNVTVAQQSQDRATALVSEGLERALLLVGDAATDATEVEIRFVPKGDRVTRVEIEHRGWERLGDQAAVWRDRNGIGWASGLPHFVSAVQPGE